MAPKVLPVTTTTSTRMTNNIDSTAQIHESAILGEGTIIRGNVVIEQDVQVGINCILEGSENRVTTIKAGCVIDDMVKIHPGVSLGEGSRVGTFSVLGHPSKASLAGLDSAMYSERVRELLVLEPTTQIGAGALIRSHAVIYSNVVIGDRFNTGHFVMIREHTRIGEQCVFGTHASCDGYTKVGDRAHIGQYAQLSQSARIGRGAFIGGQTVFSDNIKAIWDVEHDLFGATIGDYVRIGLNCTVLPTVIVGQNAFIGAGSVITKDIPEGSLVYGSPAKVSKQLSKEETQEYIDSVER